MRGASPGASPPWEGVSIPSQRGRESLCLADKHCSAFWRWAEALPHGPKAEVQREPLAEAWCSLPWAAQPQHPAAQLGAFTSPHTPSSREGAISPR